MRAGAKTRYPWLKNVLVPAAASLPALLALPACQRVVVNPAGPAAAPAPASTATVPAPAAAPAAPPPLAPVAAPASPPPLAPLRAPVPLLAGAWRGAAPGMTFSISIAPNGIYNQEDLTVRGRVLLHGHILARGAVLTFVTDSWAPANIVVDRAVSYGSAWVNPNTLVLTNLANHMSFTLHRAG